MYERFVVMGDSFSEGIGDELTDGRVRGWADLVAAGLAANSPTPVGYANLAIRGKLLGPIVAEQLEPALALTPDLLTICGGGNDLMRPKVEISYVVDLLDQVVEQARATGAHVVLLSGANPSQHLPMGSLMQKRGDKLADAVRPAFDRPGVTVVDNWADTELRSARYWSADKLHLNAIGHTRVASNVLRALDVPVPAAWDAILADTARAPLGGSRNTAAYYREHVLPWIGRRLTGRSSGDGRTPKRPTLEPVVLD